MCGVPVSFPPFSAIIAVLSPSFVLDQGLGPVRLFRQLRAFHGLPLCMQ